MAKNHSCPSGQQRFLAGTLEKMSGKTPLKHYWKLKNRYICI